jgi:peroxiredoxin
MTKAAFFFFTFVFFISLASGCNAYDKALLWEGGPYAPDFTLNDINGNQVSLSDFRDTKAVLLIFWTTWCPYCRVALRSLRDSNQELKDLGVELLTINVNEPALKASNFIKGLGPDFTVLLDSDARVSNSYGLLGVPTYFVISKSGRVIFNGNRFSKAKLKDLNLE